MVRETEQGKSYAIRFRAYGKRRQYTLGTDAEGWTQDKAKAELDYVLAAVQRGDWVPPEMVAETAAPIVSTFREFAAEWLAGVKADNKAEKTVENYAWAIDGHLVPFFGDMPLDAIDAARIDRYRRTLIAEREATGEGLSNNSINKTITRLRQIMDEAVEHGLIESNPAAGKRRKAKPDPPNRTWLDSAEKIEALIDATGKLNRRANEGRDRALICTLIFAGLRISEALDLRWCDVDLAGSRINVTGTKTEAAVRTVNMVPALLAELKDYAHLHRPGDGTASIERVFGTSGAKGRENPSNVRTRVLLPAVKVANESLAERGLQTIGSVTLHSLRRTFASLLVALDENPQYVMGQLGHRDATFTMQTYARIMQDRGIDRERLESLVSGAYRAQLGTNPVLHSPTLAQAA